MSASTCYNFMDGHAEGDLHSGQNHRAVRQRPLSPAFVDPFTTSSASLNQASSLTPVSSTSSTSGSDSAVSSFINGETNSLLSQQEFPGQIKEPTPAPRRQSTIAMSSSNAINSSPQLCHSYTLHSLEPKPFKPFKTNSEYLEAMKEDLAEWLNRLYSDLELTTENFFSQLETGAIICRHANNVTKMGRNLLVEQQAGQLSISVDLNTCSSGTCSRSSDSSASGSFINQHYGGLSSQRSSTNNVSSEHNFASGSISKRTLDYSPNATNYIDSSLPNSSTAMGSTDSSLSEDLARGYADSMATIMTDNDKEQIDRVLAGSERKILRQQPTSMASNSSICSFVGSNSSFKSYPINDPQQGQLQHRANSINWFKIKTISYKKDAVPGTFFARDNICQFILWCRSLNIIDCLLFETDDLVDRKNEKSFILCLLEVARIGFKVGMPTPLIIQLEQEIDREIENEAILLRELEKKQNKVNNNPSGFDKIDDHDNDDCNCDESACSTGNRADKKINGESSENCQSGCRDYDHEAKSNMDTVEEQNGEEVKEEEEEEEDFGPKPQVITNDLLSLHERVSSVILCCDI